MPVLRLATLNFHATRLGANDCTSILFAELKDTLSYISSARYEKEIFSLFWNV